MMTAIVISLFLGLSACRRATHNGKIDGNWRITEIHNNITGSSTTPENLFMAVQLELVQFRGRPGILTGHLLYSKGDAKMGIEFPDNPSSAALEAYGLFENPVTFDIIQLDSKSLVLKSDLSTITARRF